MNLRKCESTKMWITRYLNILKKPLSPICFIVKNGYQMGKISTKDLISYKDIKLHKNGFNLCTPKYDAPNI